MFWEAAPGTLHLSVRCKTMKLSILLIILLFANILHGQRIFDSIKVDKQLLTLPKQKAQIRFETDIVRAIQSVDKNYRIIADTLYYYKSLKYTIFETVFIETDDSVFINPLLLGDRLKTHNIVFNNKHLSIKIDGIARRLSKVERLKLYSYLEKSYDNFSMKNKDFGPQPVRIRSIKFPDERFVKVGIDIYGKHFLWTIDKEKNWDVIKVEDLWVY